MLCTDRKVKSAFAFGSVCTDHFAPSSDIDLLIAFEPMDYGDYADNFFLLAEEFEQLFQRKVDLITENSLANSFFIKAVNKTKVKIYECHQQEITALMEPRSGARADLKK